MRLNGSKFDRLISWAIIIRSDDFFNWDRSHIQLNYKLRRQFRSRNNSNFKNLRSDPIFCPLWMFLLLLFLITVLFFEAITGFNNVGTIRRLSLEAKTMSHVSWSNYTGGKKIEYFCKKSPGSGITMFESSKKNIPMAQMAWMKTKKTHFNSTYHISIDNSSKSFPRCVFTFFFSRWKNEPNLKWYSNDVQPKLIFMNGVQTEKNIKCLSFGQNTKLTSSWRILSFFLVWFRAKSHHLVPTDVNRCRRKTLDAQL